MTNDMSGQRIVAFPSHPLDFIIIVGWLLLHLILLLLVFDVSHVGIASRWLARPLNRHADIRSLKSITFSAGLMLILLDIELIRFELVKGGAYRVVPDGPGFQAHIEPIEMGVGDWLVFILWINLHVLMSYAAWRLWGRRALSEDN
ncbi:MAG TPA: hypothetical protein VLV83_09795 [Acidobacteriota bacterium]|nr:hypothetical protein [Acidobacteriota bacterium]